MSYPELFADITPTVEMIAQVTSTGGNAQTDPISFQTALLVIIAGALVFLAKNLANLNRRLATVEANKVAATPTRTKTLDSSTRSPVVRANEIEPEVVAAISAAVHTTLKGRLRILSVGPICPNRQAWSAEGRRQVFSSHKVR